MDPVSALFSAEKEVKRDSSPNSVGKDPESLFESNVNVVKSAKLPNSVGILPVSPLDIMETT